MFSNQSSDKKALINHEGTELNHIISSQNGKPLKQSNKSVMMLIIGIIGGYCFAELLTLSLPKTYEYDEVDYVYRHSHHYRRFFNKPNTHTHTHTDENKTIANIIFDQVKVLCWVMTSAENHTEKALHVKKTWGSRCNKLIFMSSVEDKDLGAVALPVSEGADNLWNKTNEAIQYLYDHHMDEYDWFLKADDETYVILENLRSMLYPYNREFPIYFGCKFQPNVKKEYLSSGAAYVLSREALRRLVEKALPDATKCQEEVDVDEDIEFEKCMHNVEIVAGDSRDEHERGRIFPFKAEYHLLVDPYPNSSSNVGINCCSDHAISFRQIPPAEMYVIDYFIYHVRIFGITNAPDPLPDKKTMAEIVGGVLNSNKSNNNFSNF